MQVSLWKSRHVRIPRNLVIVALQQMVKPLKKMHVHSTLDHNDGDSPANNETVQDDHHTNPDESNVRRSLRTRQRPERYVETLGTF